MKVVLATHNPHKVAEFQQIVASARPDLEIIAYDGPEPVEDGVTFAENALIKARAAAFATGETAFADDSGIAAEALGGRPGVYSARFAGEHATDRENLDKLLAEAPAGSRVAYVCAIAYVTADGDEQVVEGRCEGTLTHDPRGTNGFGYDPLFFIPEMGKTTAELAPEQKHGISHRGKALRRMRELMNRLPSQPDAHA